MKKIVIGSDHAGFELKKTVKTCLTDAGWEVSDAGTYEEVPVDYPDFGCKAAAMVSSGEFERGVLICGSGVGMTILANKFPGVRAVLCLDEEMARLSRMHNDTNILALAGRRTDTQQALKIITVWLETAFEGGRHQRRIDKIRQWEEKLCRGKDMPS
ncbi:MAG: ribose 5-phosphate isomerase B [Syntrophales bacterium]|nr:ribose 5-phosphate isomerase B [Syntrophales bacterium]